MLQVEGGRDHAEHPACVQRAEKLCCRHWAGEMALNSSVWQCVRSRSSSCNSSMKGSPSYSQTGMQMLHLHTDEC